MNVTTWARARPVLAFSVLTFAITWASWWPMAANHRGLLDLTIPGLFFLGGLGPGIAAYVVARVLHGPAADAELLGPLLRWRVGWVWYAVALLLPVGVWLLAALSRGTLAMQLTGLSSVSTVAVAVVWSLLAAVPEEVGWRGFALPALQARYSALTASLLVGALSAAWHLPLLLGGDPTMSTYPLVPYIVWLLAQSVLYTWLYNNTRGTLLLAVLLHGVSNVVGVFSAAPWATTGITVALAAVVVAGFGPQHLSRSRPRVTAPGTGLTAQQNNHPQGV